MAGIRLHRAELGQDAGTKINSDIRIRQGALAQPGEHLRGPRVRDALQYQRAARHEVAPAGAGGRVRGVDAVFQARVVPAGQVFRLRQLKQHLTALDAVPVHRADIGQRPGQQPGRVVVGPGRPRLLRCLPGPGRRRTPRPGIGTRLPPVRGDAARPPGVRRRFEGERGRAVQRPGRGRVEAVHDAVADQRVGEAVAPGGVVDRQQAVVPGRGERVRDAVVVPRGRAGRRGAAAARDQGGQQVVVDDFAEDRGRLDDLALRRGQRGQQAADDHGQIG